LRTSTSRNVLHRPCDLCDPRNHLNAYARYLHISRNTPAVRLAFRIRERRHQRRTCSARVRTCHVLVHPRLARYTSRARRPGVPAIADAVRYQSRDAQRPRVHRAQITGRAALRGPLSVRTDQTRLRARRAVVRRIHPDRTCSARVGACYVLVQPRRTRYTSRARRPGVPAIADTVRYQSRNTERPRVRRAQITVRAAFRGPLSARTNETRLRPRRAVVRREHPDGAVRARPLRQLAVVRPGRARITRVPALRVRVPGLAVAVLLRDAPGRGNRVGLTCLTHGRVGTPSDPRKRVVRTERARGAAFSDFVRPDSTR
jgi:hypothetical protein